MDPKTDLKMAEPLRFRLDRRMRVAVVEHARALSAAASRPLGISAALRDLVTRALDLGSPDEACLSGFREGFLSSPS